MKGKMRSICVVTLEKYKLCVINVSYLVVGANIFFVKVVHEEKKTGQQCCNIRNYSLSK